MTDNTLDKTFDPAAIEAKWYAHWETNGLFRPERPDAETFTIVLPPPNVTGSLHIGHALDHTLMDIMIRYERLRGKDALFLPGMDHAGIATQMVIERQLEQRQDKRTNYTREQFVQKVWEWKAESGGMILDQMRRLGESVDWNLQAFTMDPHFTRAVVKVFVDLYNQGLIYRDKRLVNWDPKLKTAISDLEVETREVKGSFWRFRYPFADGSGHVEVATTRPETMLADMCVAVNPEDERYKAVIGKEILQPITGRRFKVVADEHADPELGSGVVKITPGHDFNDFEVGKRAGIKPADMLNMFDAEAHVVQTADGLVPDQFVGMERFAARKLVVERMKELGFLIPHVTKDSEGNETEHDAEPRTIQTPFGDRGGVEIEPWLTDQWYVKAEELAKAPLEAVRSGAVEIVPKSWEKTFFNWMENIQPWCVSRQLWWGHRIPAWYAPKVVSSGGKTTYLSGFNIDGTNPPVMTNPNVVVAETYDAALAGLKESYPASVGFVRCDSWEDWRRLILNGIASGQHPGIDGNPVPVVQDNDVLDTWFSSALWPFATLGWPEESPSPVGKGWDGGSTPASNPHPPTPSPLGSGSLLQRHYPNDLLISGFDILFFWDARMMMMGQAMTGQNPWPRLYLHGLVRAPDGQKMSKSKGNVVDPLGLIDQFGADALRFFMAAMESQGRDIKMDERRVEGYRNFATKLWNAARFCQSNGIAASNSLAAPAAKSAVNRWIIGETVETLALLDQAMADLRFDAAANAIYHFVWDQFCDWYIELIKGSFDDETKAVAGWVLDQILVMLHPFMPFVTEELWSKLGDRANYPLITAKWPQPGVGVDAEAKAEVERIIQLIGDIRAQRTELNVPPGSRLKTGLLSGADSDIQWIDRNLPYITRMARLEPARIVVTPNITLPNATTDEWNMLVSDRIEPIVGEIRVWSSALQFSSGDLILVANIEGVIDIAAEKTRLAKALEASTKEAKSLEGRLSNAAFIDKAKPEAVEKARADHAMHAAEAERLAAALARLG